MRTAPHSLRRNRAFTRLELFVVISIVAVLLSMLLPALFKAKAKSSRINCASNLKLIALSFKMFAGDNDGCYPAHTPAGKIFLAPDEVWRHFYMLSNEMGSARILMCPKDDIRASTMAYSFGTESNGLYTLKDRAVSYFVNVDANETNASMVLIGDRNLLIAGQSPASTSLTLPGNTMLQWNRDLHGLRGNVALADGSVFSQIPSIQIWTNHSTPVRLAIP